ncbi:MAG: hypothetical protein IT306_15720 [Chloroflexi bacterium]|nr:hypothetical protein [Chloroflexota bacterium]
MSLDLLPWLSLAALGGYHGLNPGMGWLFAVALGLQEKRLAAVIRAFGPIAAGHAASVAVVVLLVGVAQLWVDAAALRWVGGGLLIAFGAYKLLVPLSHPKWVGMRVGPADLALWSFLMASAHGAGLMLMPVLLRLHPDLAAHADHETSAGQALLHALDQLAIVDLAAIGVHTLSMLVVMAALAIVVYQRVGLKILRSAWLNLDRIWAIALVITGAVTIVL